MVKHAYSYYNPPRVALWHNKLLSPSPATAIRSSEDSTSKLDASHDSARSASRSISALPQFVAQIRSISFRLLKTGQRRLIFLS